MQVRPNRVITLTMTLTDGDTLAIIDDEHATKPFVFLYDTGLLLDTLERKLKGMKPGDVFDVSLEHAYGIYNSQMVQKVAIEKLPKGIEEGMVLTMQVPGAINPMVFGVKKLDKKMGHLDGNHPLAGKNIRFRGVILDVRPASEQELAQQQVLPEQPQDVCPPSS